MKKGPAVLTLRSVSPPFQSSGASTEHQETRLVSSDEVPYSEAPRLSELADNLVENLKVEETLKLNTHV